MPGIGPTLAEFKAGTLHSGSKHGPKVQSRAQAIAIALNEERKLGHAIPKKGAKSGSRIGRALGAAQRRGLK